jgi:membrane protein DedA with SNARE-associated domain
MGLTEKIIELCSSLITTFGYTGIFVLMFFESMYVPVPSEAVMPFVGMVAHQVVTGTRTEGPDFWLGVIVAAIGGLGGSLATYYFGRWAGPVGVRRWGRYGGLVEEDLEITQRWFDRRGAVTVVLARFVPVVRHFISTVAGLARMRLGPFVVMTVVGAFLWDLFLAWLGWIFEEKARFYVHEYSEPADIIIVVLGAVALFVVARHLRSRKRVPEPAPVGIGPGFGETSPRAPGEPVSDLDARRSAP